MPDRESRRCAVIGAGLAGAAVASQLARRGWQVQVLDAADTPAAGASGLPVGLVVPHVSPDDNLLARATRAGATAMWTQVQSLLRPGEDFARTGVRELLFERGTRLSNGERWHGPSGWIRPTRLIAAWLNQPGIQWSGSSRVASIAAHHGHWRALAADGRTLAQAPHIVLCAGFGTHALLPEPIPVQALRGQLSWNWHGAGEDPAAFPRIPTNGAGNLIAHVPTPQGPAWFLGSSFVRDDTDTTVRQGEHLENLARLERLAPAAAALVREDFERGRVQAFCATRCAARDRMPVVGAVMGPGGAHAANAPVPGLWVSTAMGARGLTLALLCAQILAAKMNGEVADVEPAVLKALDSARRSLRRPLHRPTHP